jgi:hypothetical protein
MASVPNCRQIPLFQARQVVKTAMKQSPNIFQPMFSHEKETATIVKSVTTHSNTIGDM